jgi:D-alanyl-D-alanine carboxypeptidase
VGQPGDAEARLDVAVSELAAMPGGPPGVVVVVQQGDRRTVHVAGEAEVGTGTAPSAEDHVRVASVAKAFTAATALALVDDGLLGLDDTIGQRRPDLPAAWADVTLRQLLNHTSGVPDFSASPGFAPAVVASLATAPPPRALLGFVEDQPLAFAPGSEYEYSNSDNVVVALMIEAVTGRPFASVLQQQVLDPLGLDDTSLPEGVEMPRPYLHGYELEPPDPLEDVSELLAAGWAWASGGIVSTPADMNDFVRGYVGSALFGVAVQAEQRSLFIPAAGSEPPGPGWNSASLGLFRYQTPCGTVYGHSGNTFGYTQLIVASADGKRSATVSISLQRTQKSEGQAADVFEALQRTEQAAICLALDGPGRTAAD